MEKLITFDDVLIAPTFSTIQSRKDVDISSNLGDLKLNLPLISANMDTVTSNDMALALYKHGGISCLHRFCTIEKSLEDFNYIKENGATAIPSVGLGEYEFQRAEAFIENGASFLCIDVAHGAQTAVVNQYNAIAEKYPHVAIIVGNFATGKTIEDFKKLASREPLAFKVGIGGGAACLTRVQTGCGVPQLSAIIDCVNNNPSTNIISDGGKKTPGDIAKALAAGAKAVMVGSMLAGTDESPGEIINGNYKKYRGSASLESYSIQGKAAHWRTFEGDSFLVPYKGPVTKILQHIEGGLRSAFTYVGARNINEFRNNAKFIEISYSTQKENAAHGKIV